MSIALGNGILHVTNNHPVKYSRDMAILETPSVLSTNGRYSVWSGRFRIYWERKYYAHLVIQGTLAILIGSNFHHQF
ncbi:unnamed protein product [Aspergillus oryzae var. brunneus]|uniref:Unnamed protein product n=2 Tax=Aspergillus oryzae TaxID=5062 RepID=A0AAN5BZP6_ASPOZ|nr:unnamed protein product [Aspergillus oryzae]GMG33361.1 unnamed protein product [Aspergillus oryzae]GMG45124.1 unnamed protein product [Aspergillus oryzae var. brunneus]